MRSGLTARKSLPLLVAIAVVVLLTALPLRAALAGPVQALAPVTGADGRLGLCDVLTGTAPNGVPWGQLAYDAGARLNRWEFRWDRVEPQAQLWDFSATDAAVHTSAKFGLDVLGILIGTPGWAAAQGQLPGNGLPRGLFLKFNDPRNLWAQYVRETVSRYQGQVQYWEVWNEPDLHFFWTSSPEDYFQLLKIAYQVIRQTDPAARVVLAGMVMPDLRFAARVLQDASRDPAAGRSNGFFDVAAWHAYAPAGAVFSNVSRFKALLAAQGRPTTPVWVTEDGFPASNPNGEQRQAAYLLQTIVYAFEAGAEKVLVYRASDDQDPKTWGLVSASGVPRMGYVAFQVAARSLSGIQSMMHLPAWGAERFVFYEPTHRVVMLWNTSVDDLQVQVPVERPSVRISDWMGGTRQVSGLTGRLRLVLPGAAYNAGVDPAGTVVGGPPVFVTESDVTPANLANQAVSAALGGAARRILLYNGDPVPQQVQVSAVQHPSDRVVVLVPANSLRAVDLDFLAGIDYNGSYGIASTSPIAAVSLSRVASSYVQTVSTDWYVPEASRTITITNPSSDDGFADVTEIGSAGAIISRVRLPLPAFQDVVWSLSSTTAAKKTTVVVQSPTPLAVASAAGSPVPQASSTWFAVAPPVRNLAVFNPDPAAPATVSAIPSGPTGAGRTITVAPHHLVTVPVNQAAALELTSPQKVVVSYPGKNTISAVPLPAASTRTALIASGRASRIAIFNPSPQTASVSVSLLVHGRAEVHSEQVAPMQVQTVPARTTSAPPVGALVTSDVPVAASPAS